MLRSVLTAVIVAIGITSLVGILTAVDAIESSVTESLSDLGANTFTIQSKSNRGFNQQGVSEKRYPPVQLTEANRFIDDYKVPSAISLSTWLTGIAEVKRLSEKTNPNIVVMGVNNEFLTIKGLQIEQGRGFSKPELDYGVPVAIIGDKIYETLYDEDRKEMVTGTEISLLGTQFRVIGKLGREGQIAEENYDNMVLIPVIKANQLAQGRGLQYDLTVGLNDPTAMEYAMGEATGVMRAIRGDRIGTENSFELEKSETLAQELENITNGLRLGGFGVGFVTLLGASIALMNIMLVSVTERTREVGVRKALGATPLRIRQQFVIEAIVVCLIGGITGVVLGIAIGNLLAMALQIKSFVMPWMWMFVGLLVCIGVGLMAGWYPAHKASKLDPIESLRFE